MQRGFVDFIIITMILSSFGGSINFEVPSQREVIKRLPEILKSNDKSVSTNASNRLPIIEDKFAWPKISDIKSLGVDVSSKSAIVVDKSNGKVLFEKNPNEIQPIASITKLMTALVFLDTNPDLKKEIEVQDSDRVPLEGVIFRRGEKLSYSDVLHAMLISSANDAARILVRASGLSGDEFINRMNRKARDLGMAKTRFYDPSGIDTRNVSTALEITYLIKTSRENEIISEVSQTEKYDFRSSDRGLSISTTDQLLESFLNKEPYEIVLAKTGSLPEIGFSFGVSIDRNKNGIIVVVLNSTNQDSRFEDAKDLAYWAFSKWQWKDEMAKK